MCTYVIDGHNDAFDVLSEAMQQALASNLSAACEARLTGQCRNYAHLSEWLARLRRCAFIVKVNAAGGSEHASGGQSLGLAMDVWVMSRNNAYMTLSRTSQSWNCFVTLG